VAGLLRLSGGALEASSDHHEGKASTSVESSDVVLMRLGNEREDHLDLGVTYHELATDLAAPYAQARSVTSRPELRRGWPASPRPGGPSGGCSSP
jgi:hypothetical protein